MGDGILTRRGGIAELLTGIRITTKPSKLSYKAGEALDLTGMVVKSVETDGDEETLTEITDYTVSPATGSVLYETINSFKISWTKDGKTYTADQDITVVRTLSSIAITTPPTKTSYLRNAALDLTGMAITATFNSGATEDVTSKITSTPAGGSALSTSGIQDVVISYAENGVTKTSAQSITVSSPIYGVKWDGTSTTVLSRTDDSAEFVDPVPYVSGASNYGSPFDNIEPWASIKRSTHSLAGEVVSLPAFWYKFTQVGASIQLQISADSFEGASISPAHKDRGDGYGTRKMVYVGRYHCGSTYKSITGQSPKVNITRDTARTSIHALGTAVRQYDFALRCTILMLYLVEFADFNAQEKIGYGCGNNSSAQSVGTSDSMPYHTGTMQSARTTYGVGVQYRYIEGLWDNVFDWVDGCYNNSNGLNVIMNPANFSDSSGGTLIGLPTGGWPSAMKVPSIDGFDWALYPTASSGSGATYIPDSWGFDASCPCLHGGGYCNQVQNYGPFYLSYDTASTTSANYGCRLQVLPEEGSGE